MQRLQHISKILLENPWLLLGIRLVNGGIFFIFALGKAIQPVDQFYEEILQYELLQLFPMDEMLLPVVGYGLIAAELLVGALLIVGLFTRQAAQATIGLLVFFMVVIIQALLRGIPITDCGCSGGLIELGKTPAEVLTRDLVMIVSLVWLLMAPKRSALELDTFFEETEESSKEGQA